VFNEAMLAVLELIKLRCDAKVALVFDTTVFNAFCVAVETGLLISDVLLTCPSPIELASTPLTIPVNVGSFTGAMVPPMVRGCKDPSALINEKELATISSELVILEDPFLL
jgi:hypothetical protein